MLCFYGHMAELVDALVSGTSGSNTLEVQIFLCPPKLKSGFLSRFVFSMRVICLLFLYIDGVGFCLLQPTQPIQMLWLYLLCFCYFYFVLF